MNRTVEVTAEEIRITGGQWCYGRRSAWVGNVPVELKVEPENTRWSGQRPPQIKIMLGTEWQSIAPPVLDGTVDWVGTYMMNVDSTKHDQIVTALDTLLDYAICWLDRKHGREG